MATDTVIKKLEPVKAGQRYGRLVACEPILPVSKHSRWIFICDCGSKHTAIADNVRRGKARSCGCLGREITKALSTTHGMTGSSEFKIWVKMIGRCSNSDDAAYSSYGGRGIQVCDRWSDFANFFADMGFRPSLKHSIDRIDNDGPYSPENCRWATQRQQNRNYRRNIVVDLEGDKVCLQEATERLGLNYQMVWARLRRGWSIEKALSK